MNYHKLFFILIVILIGSTAYARWFQDKQYFDVDAFGQVVFSHDIHLEALGSNCEVCHNDTFNIVTKKNPTYSMAEMEEGKSCGACHNDKKAFSVTGDCLSCHTGNLHWKKDNIGKTKFSHSIHIDMGYGCDECHPDLFLKKYKGQKMTMSAMDEGEYCGACHDGDTAFSVKEDCTACHAGDLTWKKENIGETQFSHSVHLGMDYGCDECHPDLFKPEFNGQAMTMDAMSQGEYCGACHDGDTAFSSKGDCSKCHVGEMNLELTWEKESIGKTPFSHSVHLGMDYACGECHPDLFKPKFNGQKMTMSAMNGGEYCGACHDGDTAFTVKENCATCHTGAVDLKWKKDNIGETQFSHSAHLGMDYGCGDCHPDLFKPKHKGQKMTMNAMYEGEYCGACHDGDTAFSVKSDCKTCHTGEMNLELTMEDENIGKTPFSHSLHLDMDYGCSECHPDLFKPQLNGQKMTMGAMNEGEYCGACHDGDTAFTVKENCTTCHTGAVDLTWQKDNIGETQFSHSVHLGMDYGCGDCHPDLFKPKHKSQKMTMSAMNEGEYCGACHDGDSAFSVKEDCVSCHAGDMKWGDVVFSHSAHLGMDYGCDDCHPDLFKPKHKGQKMGMPALDEGKYCGACHDGDTAFSVKTKDDCAACHQK